MARITSTRRGVLKAAGLAPVAAWVVAADALACCGPVETQAELSLTAFGGAPGIADNTAALRAALAALAAQGGGLLRIGAGAFRFAADTVGAAGIALPSNVTIRGAGRAETMLRVTGAAVCSLFVAINRDHVAFEDLAIVGNGAVVSGASVYGSGAAIRWLLSPAAAADVTGFTLRRVHLENFGGPYWIDIENDAAPGRSLTMRAVVLESVTFTSRPGNSPDPRDVRINASAICINGYSGAIRDVRVTDLSGDARHIKSGIILYHQVIGATLTGVRIAAAGIAGATDDAGAYAIQIYDSGYRMASIVVERPVLDSPRSVGIYVAGGSDVAIVDPVISGQTDQRAGTLPKGAIVFNGTRRWRLTGGDLRDNWRDLDVAMPAKSTVASRYAEGRVTGVRADGSRTGIAICNVAGHVAAGVVFRDCRWRTTAQTVSVRNSSDAIVAGPAATGGYVDDIVFEDCRFEAGAGHRAIDLWMESGSPAGGYVISRCTLTGTNPLLARDQTGSLRVDRCVMRDLGSIAGTAAATLVGCPMLDVRDCMLESPGRDGVGIDLGDSRGSVRGLRFTNCVHTIPPGGSRIQLGRARPGFAGRKAQYVQNLEPAAGEPGGWTCIGETQWSGAGVEQPGRAAI